MRFVEFTEVILRKVSETQIQCIHLPRYVVAENVCSVSPGAVPGTIAGPDGNPTMEEAACVHTPAGSILVNCKMDEALYRLTSEQVGISEPKSNEEVLDNVSDENPKIIPFPGKLNLK